MASFKIHTPDNAPEQSRPMLKELQARLGFVPNIFGALAESPTVLRAWLGLKTTAETGLLSPTERKIVGLTASYLNNCSYCIAAGTTIGEKEGVSREVLDLLRADKPLKDAKHEQLRQFTKSVMKRLGRPDKTDIDAVIKAGYTQAHILEVVMLVSFGIMGNYINHIVETPLDKAFEPNCFEERKVSVRMSDAA
ncbi:MAG: carboxymuconolactone decarboxylase family protein [Alphaproteobacteria bacterium]